MNTINQKTGEVTPKRSPLPTVSTLDEEYPPDKYIVLNSVVADDLPTYMYRRKLQVRISANLDDKEVYAAPGTRYENGPGGKADWGKPVTVCLAAPAISRLSSAAAVQFDPNLTKRITPEVCERCIAMVKATGIAQRCGDCPSQYDTAYQAAAAAPTGSLANPWEGKIATKEWNLDSERRKIQREAAKNAEKIERSGKTQQEYIEDRLDQVIAERHGLAETKARNRVLRPLLGLKSTYPRRDIETKLFVVERVELRPELADPALRGALLTKAIASSQALFGGQRALTEGTVTIREAVQDVTDAEFQIVPETEEDDDEADDDPPRAVNTETGEITEGPPPEDEEPASAPSCTECGAPCEFTCPDCGVLFLHVHGAGEHAGRTWWRCPNCAKQMNEKLYAAKLAEREAQ